MAFRPLYQSKVSTARGPGLVLAIDGELRRLWRAIEAGIGHAWGTPTTLTLDGG